MLTAEPGARKAGAVALRTVFAFAAEPAFAFAAEPGLRTADAAGGLVDVVLDVQGAVVVL